MPVIQNTISQSGGSVQNTSIKQDGKYIMVSVNGKKGKFKGKNSQVINGELFIDGKNMTSKLKAWWQFWK